ncbi:hypothetical protein [Sulfitobacter mediterraneus]|uniref:Uncharacterized protein n=1 Tax=Sulfitobacter mediterraneus TaxID=83219 RepID=A0A061SPS2_9RHOB|nr:hypothetical protein [Sulfitobacter mediterraneus]KAJ01454.1 hypothetical protein PM02_19325 [Sulfitobacter mediterraneus]
MFAPVGYTPLSMLWDQFVANRIDAIYHSASETYTSEKFVAPLVRGSPLDIAEHIFSSLMWKCWPHAASSDGTVLRVHSRFEDGVPGLFTQIAPYRSCFDAVVAEMEHKNRDEIDAIAGLTFEEWGFEPEEASQWDNVYPAQANTDLPLPKDRIGKLRFHTLPICFERGRFTIVEKLPHWARTVKNNRDQEILVDRLAGWALCVPDTALEGWGKVLSGDTPILEGEVSTTAGSDSQIGRPSKIPRAVTAYQSIYPDGHSCSWKDAAESVGEDMGESISVQTLRRAIDVINGKEDHDD